MIRLFKKILYHSVYRKTVCAYALSLVVITILMLASVFGVMTSSMKQQTMNTSQQMLEQLVNSADRAQTDIANVMSVIAGSGNTLRVISEKEKNQEAIYSLFLELSNLKGFYSYIENISVWNLNSDVCVHILGDPDIGRENLSVAEEMQQEKQDILCRDISVFQEKINVISFFWYFPYQNSGIIIDVSSDLFQYSILDGSTDQREAYIIDAQGTPVTQSSGVEMGGKKISSYLYEVVSQSAPGKERIVYDDAENQQFVFLAKSESYNWWFGDIQSCASFYQSYQRVSLVFGGVLGGFLLISGVAVVLFSQKMRKHLLKIVNKCRSVAGMEEILTEDELLYIDKTIARIDHEVYMNEKYIRSSFLKNLMLGQGMPFGFPKAKVQQLLETYQAPYYGVLLIKLESTKEIPEESLREEYSIYRFTVCNLADEIFGQAYRCKTVEIEENKVAVLLLSDAYEISDEYVLCFQQIKEFCQGNLDLFLSGSMGCVVDKREDIYLSYQRAEQYMKMSRLIGKNELIDSNQMINQSYQEKNRKLTEAMIEYTKLNYKDPELSLKNVAHMFHLTTAYVGKIFKSVQGVSYASYVTQCRLEEAKELLLETNKTIGEISSELGFVNSAYFTTVFKNAYGMTPTAFRSQGK